MGTEHKLLNDGRIFDGREWSDGEGHAHCVCGTSSKDRFEGMDGRNRWLRHHIRELEET